nr:hypothetical protein JVH1_1822 [Rhodococcus sp. JVH1]
MPREIGQSRWQSLAGETCKVMLITLCNFWVNRKRQTSPI